MSNRRIAQLPANYISIIALLTAMLPVAVYLLVSQNSVLLLLGTAALAIGHVAILFSPSTTDVLHTPMTVTPHDDLAIKLHVTADGLVRAAQAINSVTTQQADGANDQVDILTRTTSLLTEFTEMSERIREQVLTTTQIAKRAVQVSQSGQEAIEQTIQGMSEIRGQVAAIADTILMLTRLTERIDTIIASVGEIATQSNMLALNASIEAARAGVQGRGFAVVADEVRTLAQQSTTAAQQVRAILGEIRGVMRQAVQATEIGMESVNTGVETTQKANAVLVQLAEDVTQSSAAVQSVYTFIRHQAEGLEDIAISVERIDRITQQNLMSTRMVETISNNLNQLADELQAVVGLEDTALVTS